MALAIVDRTCGFDPNFTSSAQRATLRSGTN